MIFLTIGLNVSNDFAESIIIHCVEFSFVNVVLSNNIGYNP